MEDLSVTANGYDFRAAKGVVQAAVDAEFLPCFSSAVLVGRNIVDLQCVGWADRESRTPLRTDHIFRIFSNTKLITACAVLLLHQDNKFGLDDAIDSFIPQMSNRRVLRPGATSIQD